jgi:predicted nucleic acid-binding protein
MCTRRVARLPERPPGRRRAREPEGAQVEDQIARWLAAGEELYAPRLVYEVASGFRGAVRRGELPAEKLAQAAALIGAVPLTIVYEVGLVRVVQIAGELERTSAYDAAYVALAERLGCSLARLDGFLAALADVEMITSTDGAGAVSPCGCC